MVHAHMSGYAMRMTTTTAATPRHFQAYVDCVMERNNATCSGKNTYCTDDDDDDAPSDARGTASRKYI